MEKRVKANIVEMLSRLLSGRAALTEALTLPMLFGNDLNSII